MKQTVLKTLYRVASLVLIISMTSVLAAEKLAPCEEAAHKYFERFANKKDKLGWKCFVNNVSEQLEKQQCKKKYEEFVTVLRELKFKKDPTTIGMQLYLYRSLLPEKTKKLGSGQSRSDALALIEKRIEHGSNCH